MKIRGLWCSVCLAAASVVAVLPAVCRADTVVMKDGKTYEGEIVKDTGDAIEINTTVSNIKTKLKLLRRDIKTIEKGEKPAEKPAAVPGPAKDSTNAPAPKPTAPAETDEKDPPASSGSSSGASVKFLVIPLSGQIGVEVLRSGIEDCLQYAERNKIQHIVLRMRAGGSDTEEAKAVAKLIAGRGEHFKFHAYVESATDAALLIALACDDLFVGGGAADSVVFSYRPEVLRKPPAKDAKDAKPQHDFAADIETQAKAKNHNLDIVHALTKPPALLVSWVDDSGKVVVGSTAPPAAKETQIEDGPSSLLSLSASNATRLGFARDGGDGPDSLGNPLDISGWKSAGGYGESAMKKALAMQKTKDRKATQAEQKKQELTEAIAQAAKSLDKAVEEAVKADPRNGHYTVYSDDHLLTPDSMVEWKKNSDKALTAWRQVQDLIARIDDLEAEMARAGLERLTKADEIQKIRTAAAEAVARITKERNRTFMHP